MPVRYSIQGTFSAWDMTDNSQDKAPEFKKSPP